MARASKNDRQAAVARCEKLRGRGERGNAVALALENKLTPEEVPFLEGYAHEYAVAGLDQPASESE